MLGQYNAIMRDLETLHIVKTQTESKWIQLQFDRIVLSICVTIFFILFLLTLGYIIFRQRNL
jgi:hypothetical protein